MPASKKDPLVEALDSMVTTNSHGSVSKMDYFFGDRPEVLEAVIRARRDRKLTHKQIAEALSKDPKVEISDRAVGTWLQRKGIS
jgi:transposase